MQGKRILRLVGLAAVAVMAVSVPTRADDSQQQTTVTLSAPVEIPGTTLQAGAYVFETTASQDGRHAVRIYSSDRSKLIVTAEAVPMKRNGELVDLVELRPTILGSAPTALKGWLRPGTGDGYQFVYPAREAAAIANRTATPVVASVAESEKAQLVVIDPYGKRSPWADGGHN
jgi:hypothetical protein